MLDLGGKKALVKLNQLAMKSITSTFCEMSEQSAGQNAGRVSPALRVGQGL